MKMHEPVDVLQAISGDQLHQLYTPVDYQLALSVVPLGVILAAILTFFLKETYADTTN